MGRKSHTPPIDSIALVGVYRQALAAGISTAVVDSQLSTYLKRFIVAAARDELQAEEQVATARRSIPAAVRFGALLIPATFMMIGIYLVGSAVLPITSYYLASPARAQSELLSPIPDEQMMDITPLVISSPATPAADLAAEPELTTLDLDYTNLTNWFSAGNLPTLDVVKVEKSTEYILDIPALKIANAKVNIGGSNLSEGLIAYPGTALPGQYGSPVIFGHSVLRQFYNPSEKNPRRYLSIFSTIMTLKPSDKIYLTHDGVKYTYLVQEKTEVKPTDVQILTQKFDTQRLKLVTCTPEGTYLRRGVVTAQLVTEAE